MAAIEIDSDKIDPVEASEILQHIKSFGVQSELGFFLFKVLQALEPKGTVATVFVDSPQT